MTFKKDKTQYNSNILSLEPRAHVKKKRVWHVLDARGAVFCSHTPSLTKESLMPVSETLWKKTEYVQVFRKQ